MSSSDRKKQLAEDSTTRGMGDCSCHLRAYGDCTCGNDYRLPEPPHTSSPTTTDLSGSFFDPPASRREMEALERRVAMLERALLSQPSAPVPAYAPGVFATRGCSCPPGAEAGCRSGMCPRRQYGGPT